MNLDACFSSFNMSWATPRDLFSDLDREFKFTLDPCADDFNHKCEKYYTVDQDGLSMEFSNEFVFCNPPYGRNLSKWVKKCHDEVFKGSCPLCVMLIPARTDTRWFHDFIYHKAEVRFIKGRIRFEGAKYNAPFPSMIVIFRKVIV